MLQVGSRRLPHPLELSHVPSLATVTTEVYGVSHTSSSYSLSWLAGHVGCAPRMCPRYNVTTVQWSIWHRKSDVFQVCSGQISVSGGWRLSTQHDNCPHNMTITFQGDSCGLVRPHTALSVPDVYWCLGLPALVGSGGVAVFLQGIICDYNLKTSRQ